MSLNFSITNYNLPLGENLPIYLDFGHFSEQKKNTIRCMKKFVSLVLSKCKEALNLRQNKLNADTNLVR